MRTMLVAPGVPSGTPATMMTRWPDWAKPSAKAMRQARSTMSSWSRASSATTQWTPHTSASLRPLARDPQRGRARRGPAHDRGEIEGLGDLARGGRDGVGAGRFRIGALGVDDGAIGRIALDFLGDAVHRGDRFDRELPRGGFRRQHHRVGAFED